MSRRKKKQHNGEFHDPLPLVGRKGFTHQFTIDGVDGYLITGEYDDGRLGQIFFYVSKQGSTLRGLFDALATAVSLGLQHGVPLGSYVEKYIGQTFEPSGMTHDAEIRTATSVVDYVFRRLALDYLDAESLRRLGIDPVNA